jgi:hypothetical protein
VLGVLLTPLVQEARNNSGRRLSEDGTEHERDRDWKPCEPHDDANEQGGKHDLPGSQSENLVP